MVPERAPTLRAPALCVVDYGAHAKATLLRTIVDVRGGDSMAPCTVVVPSSLAGVTLRRSLAQELGGLLCVSFLSLAGLAEQLAAHRLAAGGRLRLDRRTLEALVASALVGRPGRLSPDQPATVAAVAQTISELRALDERELDALSTRSARATEVVRVLRLVRDRSTGWVDAHDALIVATESVLAGDPVVDEVGPVVLHLPRVLTRPELGLMAALHTRGLLHAIVGRTGRPGADAVMEQIVNDLVAMGLAVSEDVGLSAPPVDPAGTTVLLAPDPAEEVRHCVRVVLDALGRGMPPERIAIVSRGREPYALIAHEELDAAGVAHSAPAPTQLAQSMAGRTILGLLGWLPRGARRSELMSVLRAAPVLDHEGGRTPVDRWDRLARRAGVVAGLDQWTQRLAAAAEDRAAYLAARIDPTGGERPSGDDDVDRDLVELGALATFVEHLSSLLDVGDASGWRALARWAERVLVATLGGDRRIEGWPEHERSARDAVLETLNALAALDGIAPTPDLAAFVRVLDHELRRASGRVGRFGHGVTVGRLADAAGADLDLVVVLGGSEGVFPPRRADDALLPERDRRGLSGLRPHGNSRDEEERDLWAALASAPSRLLTAPTADPRSQRVQQVAPWVVELASERAGTELTSDELRGAAVDGVVRLPSFEAWLADGGEPATPTERDVAAIGDAHRAGVDVAFLPFVVSGALSRGFAAARSRRDGSFDEWAGNVGAWPELSGALAEHRSPTGLESWAVCPARYFFGKVLGVRGLDDPAYIETIEPRDRGSLVHAVMERFVGERLHIDPSTAWSAADQQRLMEIADELEAALRARGRTGRDLLWRSEWRALRRHLVRIVEHGMIAPELRGTAPVAVEHAFGFGPDEAPPVEIVVRDGRPLRFGGRIDRIDSSADGRKLVVVDYKTSSSQGYERLTNDIVDRGAKLQLPIYAAAARGAVSGAEQVAAYYWFVSPRHRVELRGGMIDARADERFRSVLGTIVDGIEGGLFPARPGEEDWRPATGPGHSSCRYCDFDRLCPGGRGERWQQVRLHPALAQYVQLAEGPDPHTEAGPAQ